MSDKAKALSLIADPQIRTTGANLTRLQTNTIAQLEKIRGLENEAALRAVFTGLALNRIKFSMERGTWMPWLKDNAKEVGQRQANYYMKLAIVFLVKTRAAKTEMLVLAGDRVELSDHSGAALAKKAESFVGDLSLNELLEKHGIKGLTRGGDDDDGEDLPHGGGAGEQMIFTEISGHLFGLRETVLNRENIMRLEPKQLDALKTEIERTRTEFLKLYEQARGKK